MKHIKDAVHGYIDVPEEELSIINTGLFQRLREIEQLGTSSTVYPSATHTRFSHSIGTMYLARQLSDSVNLPEKQARENQIAGLLHDVGHLPFSHTLESRFYEETGKTHEDISCKYIDRLYEADEVLFPVDKQNVKDIVKGQYYGTNLISNEIDCDRLDYLLRDSYNTGIRLGEIEHETLIKFSKTIDGKLGFNHKSLRSVERLLDARMQMKYSVYSHDTVNIAERMLNKSVEMHAENTDFSYKDIIGLEDCELSRMLLSSEVEGTRILFKKIKERDLHKTAYFNPLTRLDSHQIVEMSEQFTDRKQEEKKIADLLNIEPYQILISPPKHSKTQEFQTPIEMPSGRVESLESISSKPKSLREKEIMNENFHIFVASEYEKDFDSDIEEYVKDSIQMV